jgi:ribosome recycling factor
MDPALRSFEQNLRKVIDHLKSEFARLQTGRASAALIENVLVEAYGSMQPLKSLAGIGVENGRTLVVQPWDPSILAEIEKVLRKADGGVQPVNEGGRLRLVFPPMTEERRKQLVKVVHDLAEEAHISIRQQRQEVHSNVKRDKSRSEDEHFRLEKELQMLVDHAQEEITQLEDRKEKEVLTV